MEFDFSKNRSVEDIGTVPEDFRGLYHQPDEEGPYILQDDGPTKSAVAAIMRLNTSLKSSRTEAKNHKKKIVDLGPLSEYGETVADILEAFGTKLAEGKTAQSKTVADQVEKIKQDLAKGHGVALEQKEKRSTALQKQLYALLGTGAAEAALDGKASSIAIALPFVEDQLMSVEDDTGFNVRVKDEAGDARYSSVTGTFMTPKELVAEMQGMTKWALLFKSELPEGGGQDPSGGDPVKTKGKTKELTSIEKIRLGLKKNQHQGPTGAGRS